MAKYQSTQKIDSADLRIGMFVAALEVPWSITEFPLQGVLVKSSADIAKISQYSKRVEIDQNKSQSANPVQHIAFSKPLKNVDEKVRKGNCIWRKLCTEQYAIEKPISKQLKPAKQLLDRVHQVFDELKEDLASQKLQSVDKIKVVSGKIVSSLLQNPDALLWLTKVKMNHGKIYDHTVRCSIWATLMGRSMGLKQSSLNVMIEAILLSGIGKAYLPKSVWQKHNPAEMKPEFAVAMNHTIEKLSLCKIEHRVLTIIANMNERYDGSGYPTQILQDKIPYLSQMAGLVETFDLLLHPMHCTKKRSFGQALSRLYCFRDSLFNGELIEEFIRATGLYPAGTIVILSNGYRGVVVEQTKNRRIRATVALTHDAQDYRLLSYQVVKLGENQYKDVIIKQEANLHQLNDDDMKRINSLVAKYQNGVLSNIVSSLFS